MSQAQDILDNPETFGLQLYSSGLKAKKVHGAYAFTGQFWKITDVEKAAKSLAGGKSRILAALDGTSFKVAQDAVNRRVRQEIGHKTSAQDLRMEVVNAVFLSLTGSRGRSTVDTVAIEREVTLKVKMQAVINGAQKLNSTPVEVWTLLYPTEENPFATDVSKRTQAQIEAEEIEQKAAAMAAEVDRRQAEEEEEEEVEEEVNA